MLSMLGKFMYMGMQMFDAFQANGESRTYDWRKTNTWLGWKGAETAALCTHRPDGGGAERPAETGLA
ncbi:MAG: hypothetical protein QNI97_05495 [Desulfobacterales bacterium]|nr:hypothetical protein [Desulfobacterales bacterium]